MMSPAAESGADAVIDSGTGAESGAAAGKPPYAVGWYHIFLSRSAVTFLSEDARASGLRRT